MPILRSIKYRCQEKIGIFVGTLEGLWEEFPGAIPIKIKYNYISDKNSRRWRDIPGYEGLYQCSNKKEIKSLPRIIRKSNGKRTVSERIMRISENGAVILSNANHKKKRWTVKQLYKLTFEK